MSTAVAQTIGGSMWRGEENPQDSLGANDANWYGQPDYVMGEVGEAFGFNGNNYLSCSRPIVNPVNFSITAWFKTSNGGTLVGFNSNPSGAGTADRVLWMSGGIVNWGVWAGHYFEISAPTACNDNQWHYVVATQSNSTGVTLYIDGC